MPENGSAHFDIFKKVPTSLHLFSDLGFCSGKHHSLLKLIFLSCFFKSATLVNLISISLRHCLQGVVVIKCVAP